MDINIIFIHKGSSWYLPYAINQAAFANPTAKISVLGSPKDSKYHNTFPIFDYQSDYSKRFTRVYEHRSSNCYDFECFCWLRWFYLRDHMRGNSLDHVWYFDSDVLVYESLIRTQLRFIPSKYRCGFIIPDQDQSSLHWSASGHSSFWGIDALETFCEFIISSFILEECKLLYDHKFQYHINNNQQGGVCDMTTLYLFWRNYPHLITNLLPVHDNSVFDLGIGSADGYLPQEFLTHAGMKVVSFDGSTPMLHRIPESTGKVRACTLHFQGRAKQYIPSFYRGDRFRGKVSLDLRNAWRVLKSSGSGVFSGKVS